MSRQMMFSVLSLAAIRLLNGSKPVQLEVGLFQMFIPVSRQEYLFRFIVIATGQNRQYQAIHRWMDLELVLKVEPT